MPPGQTAEVRAVRAAFGVSAAKAEANLAVQHRATKVNIVEQLEEKLGNSYAGVWFDNQAGEFVVPVSPGASAAVVPQGRRAAVAEEFAAAALPGHYRIEAVEFSRSELVAAQAELHESLSGELGPGKMRTALDPSTNAVEVMVAESVDPKTLAAIRRLVGRAPVRVEIAKRPDVALRMRAAGGCSDQYRSCERPFRGAQQIWSSATPDPNSELGGPCTAGFRANGLDGRKYILTAGHCVKDVHSGAVDWHWVAATLEGGGLARKSIGTTTQWHWPGKDWAKIDATGTWWDTAPWPTVLGLWEYGPHDYPIVGEARSWVGQTLCHTGAATGTTCGQVIKENVAEEYDWHGKEKVNGMFEVFGKNLCVGDGDSGGPIFTDNIALGILSGGVGNQCYTWILFGDIMEANAGLNVNIAGPGAPEAITGAPGAINNEQASVSGQVNPRGVPTSYQVEYGIGAFTHSTGPASAGSGQGFSSVFPTLSGLEPNRVYQYRLRATNALNSATGATGTFKTAAWPAVDGNLPPTEITGKQARARALVRPENAAGVYWFEYAPSPLFTNSKESPLANVGAVRGPIEVSQTLTELSPATKYWYRVVINTTGGLKIGPAGSFTTGPPGWTLLSRFGAKGTEPGQFNGIAGVAVDAAGNAYVADAGNHRVQKFSPDGDFLLQFGVKGSAPGQLLQPRGVAIDQAGDIWVADAGNKRIQEFTPAGAFIQQIGPNEGANRPSSATNSQIAIGGNGRVYLAQEDGIVEYSSVPNPEGRYYLRKLLGNWWPKGLTRHPVDGRAYFVSREKFALMRVGDGSMATKVCDLPTNTTPAIKAPEGLTIDSAGDFFVSSSNEHAVVQLGPSCQFRWGFGTKGTGPGQMTYPSVLALTPSGTLFVGESGLAGNPAGITRWGE